MPSYDESVQALYQAPLDRFVEERKRLALELGVSEPGAAKLFLKLPRPSVSAWAVNQLFSQARDAFRELFATGERLRTGDLEGTAAHRRATNRLLTRAAEILRANGHGASDATLRKVAANLAALVAAGGFDPDLPGALRSDRDPPGFGALSGMSFDAPAAPSSARAAPADTRPSLGDEERARAEAERKRLAEEQVRLRAERKNVEGALRAATTVLESRTRDRERLAGELAAAEAELASASAQVERLSQRLNELSSLVAANEPPESHA